MQNPKKIKIKINLNLFLTSILLSFKPLKLKTSTNIQTTKERNSLTDSKTGSLNKLICSRDKIGKERKESSSFWKFPENKITGILQKKIKNLKTLFLKSEPPFSAKKETTPLLTPKPCLRSKTKRGAKNKKNIITEIKIDKDDFLLSWIKNK